MLNPFKNPFEGKNLNFSAPVIPKVADKNDLILLEVQKINSRLLEIEKILKIDNGTTTQ